MSQRYDKFIDQASLKASIEALSPMGVRFATRILDLLSSPPQAEASDTWLANAPDWIEYFGITISVHHGTTAEPHCQTNQTLSLHPPYRMAIGHLAPLGLQDNLDGAGGAVGGGGEGFGGGV